jgi:hypothetical protein
MSSMRKLDRRLTVARARYESAVAELIAARQQVASDPGVEDRPDVAALKRRAAAYRVQMEAAERAVEDAYVSRGAA